MPTHACARVPAWHTLKHTDAAFKSMRVDDGWSSSITDWGGYRTMGRPFKINCGVCVCLCCVVFVSFVCFCHTTHTHTHTHTTHKHTTHTHTHSPSTGLSRVLVLPLLLLLLADYGLPARPPARPALFNSSARRAAEFCGGCLVFCHIKCPISRVRASRVVGFANYPKFFPQIQSTRLSRVLVLRRRRRLLLLLLLLLAEYGQPPPPPPPYSISSTA